MTDPSSSKNPVPSQAYTNHYYETDCDGYREFSESHGRSIPLRLKLPLKLAGVKPKMRVVDIGCGRGEVVLHAVQQGVQVWGLDYSSAAVEIAFKTLKENLTGELFRQCVIQRCDATRLPFQDKVIDRVFMLDVVEHLTPEELSKTLQEVFRILKPGGFLIVHTMPSLWYYRYGYPIFRFINTLRKTKLPVNPRERCNFSHVHVNEQTPLSLRKVLLENGFKARIWLQTTQDYAYEKNRLVRSGMKFLVSVYPFRWIFCNDIFAIGNKTDE